MEWLLDFIKTLYKKLKMGCFVVVKKDKILSRCLIAVIFYLKGNFKLKKKGGYL